MNRWQLQDAKARLSELVKAAIKSGHQEITVRGEATAVVLSRAEFEKLKRPKPSLVEFMRRSPLTKVELNLKREQTLTRKIKL